MAVRDVASRAEGYGMPGVVVDGSDVLACYAAMRTARDRAIAGDGPTLIECKTYRFLPHTSDDDDKSYRSRQEVDEHRHSDPLDRSAAYLLEHQIADQAALDAMRAEVTTEVEAAITTAWDAADPDPATAMRYVFAERTPARNDERDQPRHRDPRHPARRDGGRRPARLARRGRRRARGRLQGLAGLPRRVRRGPGDRHAPCRIGHRRRRDRDGDARHAPDRRDRVRRLHPSGVRPDRVRGRSHALPHEQRLGVPARDPRALWRRDPRRAVSLAVDRSLLRARAGVEGGAAVHARRRGGSAAGVDPRSRPRAVPRAQEAVTGRSRARCPRATTSSRSAPPSSRARAPICP